MGIGCFNDHPVWMTVGMGDDGGNYAQMASMQTGELLWFIKIVWLGVCDIYVFPNHTKGMIGWNDEHFCGWVKTANQ